MIDIIRLEKRWYRYKIKKLLPKIVILIAIISSLVLALFFISSTPKKNSITQKEQSKSLTIKKIQTKKVQKQPLIKIQKKEPKKEKTKQQQTLLKPSLDFLTTLEKEEKNKVVSVALKKKKVLPQKKEKKSNVKIVINNSKNDIDDVIQRFNSTNNPALSLFIAQKYYEQKKYKKAYNYALRTNKIDNNIEESWIIFIKSLVKLHKKKMALDILQRYIDNSKSQKAQQLLVKIKNGTLQ
jgi:predicted Zn-dependent protease